MSAETEVHIIVDVDVERVLACESALVDCGNEAEWASISPCGRKALLCNPHAESDKKLLHVQFPESTWRCRGCEYKYLGKDVKFIKI